VDFIDFSPGALAQFVNMRAGRFNPLAITGLQPGDEKRHWLSLMPAPPWLPQARRKHDRPGEV
jgi:hypothetical protein